MPHKFVDNYLMEYLDEQAVLRGRVYITTTLKAWLRKKTAAGVKIKRKPIPRKWVADAWVKQQGVCSRCGKDLQFRDMVGDHLIALADGGRHSKWNIRALHKKCNESKGANDLITESKKTGQTVKEQLQTTCE